MLWAPLTITPAHRRQLVIVQTLVKGATVIALLVTITFAWGGYQVSILAKRPLDDPFLIPILAGITVYYGCLHLLSHTSWYRLSAACLVGSIWCFAAFSSWHWGVDVPFSLLLYALSIVLAAIIINTPVAIATTILSSVTLATWRWLQLNQIVLTSNYWRTGQFFFENAVVYIIMLLLLMIIAWLYNREIQKSWQQAEQSQLALKAEKDSLDKTVQLRTRQLQEATLRQITQLQHFAQIGKISAELLHDLVNPLTTVSFNLKALQTSDPRHYELVVTGIQHMQRYIQAARQQLKQDNISTFYCVNEEIAQALSLLETKAKQRHIKLVFIENSYVRHIGNPVALHKIVLNLVSNAIESYRNQSFIAPIVITLTDSTSYITITVADQGCGISPEFQKHIFDPFFSTKQHQGNVGLGLSLCQDLAATLPAQLSFTRNETISCNRGSTFTLIIAKT